MSASLRFVSILFGCATIGALASGVVQHRQETAQARRNAEAMTGGRVKAGERAIERHACGSCHIIPGIAAADGRVGPSMRGMSRRAVLAGRLTNEPANLAMWIRFPQRVSPGNAMPEEQMSQQDARDISAYLYTLR